MLKLQTIGHPPARRMVETRPQHGAALAKRSALHECDGTPRLGRCVLAAALLGVASGAAFADDSGLSVRFSGFGTLGVAHSSEKNADFASVGDQPNGTGYTRAWDFNPDSKLAAQVDISYGDRLSATAQLMSRYRYDGSHRPELMMAFAKWRATPQLAVRAGRLPVPIFLVSDSRTVGYSQAQLRPPVDMYGANLFHFDGADLTWTTHSGDLALKSQVYAGTTQPKLPGDAALKLAPIAGANLTGETGDLTFRASWMYGKASALGPAIEAAFDGVRAGFPAGSLGPDSPEIPGDPALADRFGLTKKKASYTSFGLGYDPGRWFLTGELGFVSAVGLAARQTLGYVSGGVRVGSFTPYATVSKVKPKIAGATTHHPVVDAMRESSAATGQQTVSLGLRWDVMKNVALKAQLDRAKPDRGSSGQLTNLQPGFQPGVAYTVTSAAIDFVF
jgi:hypothetical protein